MNVCFHYAYFSSFTYPRRKNRMEKAKTNKIRLHTHAEHFSHQMISFPFHRCLCCALFSKLFACAWAWAVWHCECVCIYDFLRPCNEEINEWKIPIGCRRSLSLSALCAKTDVYQTVWLVKLRSFDAIIWIPLVWKI